MACKVHRVRFYNPKPRAVNSLAFSRRDSRLALSRDDASIEVWDLSYAPLLLKVIPGIENGSVEALGWVDKRLLSTGLGGALVEWDLDKLMTKSSALLTGYAAWCLDVNAAETRVAVGTEQGYVNLFSVETEDVVYEKLFDKQEGRIICCKFDKTGNVLVTGSIATLRIWNVLTGQALHRMVTNRRGKETIVWSVAVLSDLTIVSGDSEGRLTFWDGNIAEQIESFATHKADILTLAVSEDERSIYCSGVDPTIVNFTKVEVPNKDSDSVKQQWVKNVQRHVHEHDVRVLAIQGNKLISMGADGYIALSSYPPKWLMRVPPMLPASRLSASPRRKLLLVRYSSHLEVWKLGKYCTNNKGEPLFVNNTKDFHKNTNQSNKSKDKLEQDSTNHGLALQDVKPNNAGKVLKLEEQPAKLVSIRAKGNRQLKCCAISPDGQYIVYSTDEVIRLFKLELDEEGDKKVFLLKVFMSSLSTDTCSRAVFTADSESLLLQWPGHITVLHLDDSGATLAQDITTETYLKECPLHLTSSTTQSGVTYVVAADTGGCVGVWAKERGGKVFRPYAALPRYKCAPSAIAVDSEGKNLVISYVDQKILEYDLMSCRFSEWPSSKLPKQWLGRNLAVTAIRFHPTNKQLIIFQDEASVWVLDKSKLDQNDNHEPESKKKAGQKNKGSAALKIIRFKYLAGLEWLGEDEAVAVEILPENIISQLPPVLATKRFPSLA